MNIPTIFCGSNIFQLKFGTVESRLNLLLFLKLSVMMNKKLSQNLLENTLILFKY